MSIPSFTLAEVAEAYNNPQVTEFYTTCVTARLTYMQSRESILYFQGITGSPLALKRALALPKPSLFLSYLKGWHRAAGHYGHLIFLKTVYRDYDFINRCLDELEHPNRGTQHLNALFTALHAAAQLGQLRLLTWLLQQMKSADFYTPVRRTTWLNQLLLHSASGSTNDIYPLGIPLSYQLNQSEILQQLFHDALSGARLLTAQALYNYCALDDPETQQSMVRTGSAFCSAADSGDATTLQWLWDEAHTHHEDIQVWVPFALGAGLVSCLGQGRLDLSEWFLKQTSADDRITLLAYTSRLLMDAVNSDNSVAAYSYLSLNFSALTWLHNQYSAYYPAGLHDLKSYACSALADASTLLDVSTLRFYSIMFPETVSRAYKDEFRMINIGNLHKRVIGLSHSAKERSLNTCGVTIDWFMKHSPKKYRQHFIQDFPTLSFPVQQRVWHNLTDSERGAIQNLHPLDIQYTVAQKITAGNDKAVTWLLSIFSATEDINDIYWRLFSDAFVERRFYIAALLCDKVPGEISIAWYNTIRSKEILWSSTQNCDDLDEWLNQREPAGVEPPCLVVENRVESLSLSMKGLRFG
ncbi:hypothetical protein KC963_02055 [Candidatus Saccharibacteria bacterium]|nr:hypothetical protein [Candidatus Saccharibacteria bacterium]